MSKRPHHSARMATDDSEEMERYGLSDNGALSPGAPSPGFHAPTTGVPTTHSAGEFGRKRSLIRPERTRIDKDHPQYHYRQHAAKQGMSVLPSTTGNDPILEDHTAEAASASSDSTDLKSLTRPPTQRFSEEGFRNEPKRVSRKLTRKESVKKQAKKENIPVISLWTVYCAIITFWMPNAVLKCFGKVQKEQQRAWREKMGLISIILCIMAFVGFITFGFTQAVCGTPTMRIQVNKVDPGYLIIHGKAYNLVDSQHPVAVGMPKPMRKAGPNVLYDLPDTKNGGMQRNGGKDASFMFQNVNGECKGMIKPKKDSGVPQDGDKVAWYFPCVLRNQDGSTKYNATDDAPYLGYACHTSKAARDAYYGLQAAGDVFFTWGDLTNTSRKLTTFAGVVLDLDLLNWFNTSQVTVPAEFKDLQNDKSILYKDITHKFQSAKDKKLARCLTEIARVGSIDTETVGCIASKVVLYVSLVFIVAIVAVKFVLALFFSWFLSWRLGAQRTKGSVAEMKQRRNEIEDWSEDIYAPPPKLRDVAGPDRANKRGSFLPTTSRFTSPYAHESTGAPKRNVPTTMASQSASRLLPPSPMYRQNNGSNGSLQDSSLNLPASSMGERLSGIYSDDIPMGFIHDQVVPQPPPDFRPFGFPLIHNICLVTAYSEGPEGMRTTLDSLATTDYPNSHKMIFIICDGLIKGHGETRTTPDVCLSMMKDFLVPPEQVRPFSYVAVATGAKRHNMAKVYAGFYDYGNDSKIPAAKQQRVPVLCVVKCGTPEEKTASKPGNRGKRDSQIILMSFLQKVMFDERMTELEYEMFNGIWRITGISPDYYETVLMVDADTKVFPDSLTHMIAAMVHDPEVMGLCGETKIANKSASWVSRIQVFEYFISHHLTKAFESVFGGVTCLPGCFCMYRVKAPKGGASYWVPILANPDIVEHYSENIVDTLHKKNLLLLGEDRYLSTLMLKTFPKRKQIFVPQAVCKTVVPDEFKVLLSQRRRWINSTVHNLMELVLVRDLCGTFCFSMQFVIFIELIGTTVLPAAIAFTFYLVISTAMADSPEIIPLVLLALILGLPAVLIVLTAHRWSYVLWMLIYLCSLPIWNFVLPVYSFWKFDDFSWGDTRKVEGEVVNKSGHDDEGEFDSTKIVMKRWCDFERERRARVSAAEWAPAPGQAGNLTTGEPTDYFDV